jgi:maltose alpha-D-glucosyltransferase/alpha-amylase
MINDLWYKNGVIYCLSVGTFMDANGDGIGDFQGLLRRLDYINGLGINTIWLLPFQSSPGRDDGYDISDYYNVDPRYGTLGDFVEFAHGAKQRGIRIIVDLVVNHTSDQHHWFKDARRDPNSKYRDWYVWSRKRPKSAGTGMVFPGVQKSTWSRDAVAKAWYFHRFYDFQPDLNTTNPEVQAEILKIMGFWIQLGVSGFRMDAVPFVIASKGPNVRKPTENFDMLRSFREFLQWRDGDAIILAEANVLPDTDLEYFGKFGERMQMMFNFHVNQHLFYALASSDARPLTKALKDTKQRPATAQWGLFLRNHDELDLGNAALRSWHPPATCVDARRRPAQARTRLQPDVHAARHAGGSLWRRTRHGRQSRAARAQLCTDANAMVGRAERGLHQERQTGSAYYQQGTVRL